MPKSLFNRGSRQIEYVISPAVLGAEGQVVSSAKTRKLLPNETHAVPDSEANRLIRLYGSELVDVANVTMADIISTVSVKPVSPVTPGDETDGLKHTNELAERLTKAKAERETRQTEAYEKAKAEGFSDAEASELAGITKAPEKTDETKAPEEKKSLLDRVIGKK